MYSKQVRNRKRRKQSNIRFEEIASSSDPSKDEEIMWNDQRISRKSSSSKTTDKKLDDYVTWSFGLEKNDSKTNSDDKVDEKSGDETKS